MRNKIKNNPYLQYILALLLLSVAFYALYREHYIALLSKITALDLAVSIALCFLIFLLTGIRNAYLFYHKYKVHIKYFDLVTLPITMNLWGIILPFQGSLLYFVLFLRNKYNIKATEGTAIVLYIYYIGFILAGLFGLYYTWAYHILKSNITYASVVFILIPLIIPLFNFFLRKFKFEPKGFLARVQSLVNQVDLSSKNMLSDLRTNLVVLILTLLRLIVRVVWFYWSATVFDINYAWQVIVVLALVTDFSSIIRLVPGNIGVDEFLTGGVLLALGGTMGEGILITILTRFSSLILTFTVGTWATMINFEYFGFKKLKEFWFSLKKTSVQTGELND